MLKWPPTGACLRRCRFVLAAVTAAGRIARYYDDSDARSTIASETVFGCVC